MSLTELVSAALELGVIPALALFLVVSLYFQNRQLLRDKKEIEMRLLETLTNVVSDNQKALDRVYRRLVEEKERKD